MKTVTSYALAYFFNGLKNIFAIKEHVHNEYVLKDSLSNNLNSAYADYVLLASYDRKDTTTYPEPENFTLTFSESINNFAMLFLCVRSATYVLGSTFIPTEFFKSGVQFELNCINDQEKAFHGNLKYLTDTTGSGKLSGYSPRFEVYGFLRIK